MIKLVCFSLGKLFSGKIIIIYLLSFLTCAKIRRTSGAVTLLFNMIYTDYLLLLPRTTKIRRNEEEHKFLATPETKILRNFCHSNENIWCFVILWILILKYVHTFLTFVSWLTLLFVTYFSMLKFKRFLPYGHIFKNLPDWRAFA